MNILYEQSKICMYTLYIYIYIYMYMYTDTNAEMCCSIWNNGGCGNGSALASICRPMQLRYYRVERALSARQFAAIAITIVAVILFLTKYI